MRRVLETRAFFRWRTLADSVICLAAREIEAGRFEADLGGGVVKRRIAYPGRGKRGGARVLVAHRSRYRVVFLAGRDKADPGSDFSPSQVGSAQELAAAFERLDREQVEFAIAKGALRELCREKVDRR